MASRRSSSTDIALIAGFAALVAVCALLPAIEVGAGDRPDHPPDASPCCSPVPCSARSAGSSPPAVRRRRRRRAARLLRRRGRSRRPDRPDRWLPDRLPARGRTLRVHRRAAPPPQARDQRPAHPRRRLVRRQLRVHPPPRDRGARGPRRHVLERGVRHRPGLLDRRRGQEPADGTGRDRRPPRVPRPPSRGAGPRSPRSRARACVSRIELRDVTVRLPTTAGDVLVLDTTSLTLTEQRVALIGGNGPASRPSPDSSTGWSRPRPARCWSTAWTSPRRGRPSAAGSGSASPTRPRSW